MYLYYIYIHEHIVTKYSHSFPKSCTYRTNWQFEIFREARPVKNKSRFAKKMWCKRCKRGVCQWSMPGKSCKRSWEYIGTESTPAREPGQPHDRPEKLCNRKASKKTLTKVSFLLHHMPRHLLQFPVDAPGWLALNLCFLWSRKCTNPWLCHTSTQELSRAWFHVISCDFLMICDWNILKSTERKGTFRRGIGSPPNNRCFTMKASGGSL